MAIRKPCLELSVRLILQLLNLVWLFFLKTHLQMADCVEFEALSQNRICGTRVPRYSTVQLYSSGALAPAGAATEAASAIGACGAACWWS